MRVPKGCPLCAADVLGTFETGFYCQECNLMYRKRHVVFRHLREKTRARIREHFGGEEAPEGEWALLEDAESPPPDVGLERLL